MTTMGLTHEKYADVLYVIFKTINKFRASWDTDFSIWFYSLQQVYSILALEDCIVYQ